MTASTSNPAAAPDLAADELESLRYPIGRFRFEATLEPAARAACIERIAALPRELARAVEGLDDRQLDTPYRPGGWTVRQVVHHVADSHMNGYTRVRLALTEDTPTIKPYAEAEWARLDDARLPVEVSLRLLEALHERWVVTLRGIADRDFVRTVVHPEWDHPLSLDVLLQNYDWHGRHHTGHVVGLRGRMGW